jgi:hypothetical protein
MAGYSVPSDYGPNMDFAAPPNRGSIRCAR